MTRAKASAWLTLLSPITQWAGLKGDQLAHKRELLRIQQEETLTEILRCAAPGIARLERPIKPIPVKFLVPFLENASLEEPDSELVRMWANLLVSSATRYDETFVHYVRLISQISSEQAKLFEAIIGPRGADSVENSLAMLEFTGLSDHIRRPVMYNVKRPITTLSRAWKHLTKILNIEGVVVKHIEVGKPNGHDDYTNGAPHYSIYTDDKGNDFEVLESLRLLRYEDTGVIQAEDLWEVKVKAYYVSPLGLSFAAACGVGKNLNGHRRSRRKEVRRQGS